MEQFVIYALVLLIGGALGFIVGLIKADGLETALAKELVKGKTVSVIIDDKGVEYKKEDGKLVARPFSVEQRSVEDESSTSD